VREIQAINERDAIHSWEIPFVREIQFIREIPEGISLAISFMKGMPFIRERDTVHLWGDTTHCFVTWHHEWRAAETRALNVRHDSIKTCDTTHCFVTWHSEWENVWHDSLFRDVTFWMRGCWNQRCKGVTWLNPCVWHGSFFRDVTSRMKGSWH